MKPEELEAKVKTLSETVAKLEGKLTRLEDIEAIKKLQRAYGYYLEHWQEDQIIDLWSHSDDVTAQTGRSGQYKGWEEVRDSFRFEDHYTAYNGAKKAPPEFLHILMPLAGIVDITVSSLTSK